VGVVSAAAGQEQESVKQGSPQLMPEGGRSQTNNVLAVILGGGAGTRLYPLTKNRAKPAVPIGGAYRLIDVPMSNCINSGMSKIYILTQFNSTSLNRHLAKTYNFGAGGVRFGGEGFVEVLAATQTPTDKEWFQGTADAVRQYAWLFEDIKNRNVEEIVILSGDHLYRMDYMRFVDHHRATNADVTIGCLPMDDSRASDFGLMKIDGDGRIVEFAEKPKGDALKAMAVDTTVLGLNEAAAKENPYIASMGIYVFKKQAMIDLLKQHPEMNDFGGEIIPKAAADYKVMAYLFNDYWEDIGTIKSFFHANLALTANPPKFEFHNPEGPIYTSPRFLPPAKIVESSLTNAIVSHGAMVKQSTVKRSIIGLRSRIGPGTVIEDTMIMGADYYESDEQRLALESKGGIPIGIGSNTHLKNVIVDKNARIGTNCKIINAEQITEAAREEEGYYIRDGIVVVLRNGTIRDNTTI
jgi:glucose-1-phosphate adenylyltransferase